MNGLKDPSREKLLYSLSAATFIIFFQLYMVAPLIPALSAAFRVPEQKVGLIVPAYLIPYGISTLFYGLLADRIGSKRVVLSSLLVFSVLTALTAFSQSVNELVIWRFFTGVGASGVVPIALAWIGQTYKFEERGRPLGWLFGAMAGGGALGSSLGVFIEPFFGWRMLFISVSLAGAITLSILYLTYQKVSTSKVTSDGLKLSSIFKGYHKLLSSSRGKRAYAFVLLNAIFHAGVFTWLGMYFKVRFHLDEMQIGLALLGYGVPGFLFGPYFGKLADRFGRGKLLPLGLALSASSAFILIFNIPLGLSAVAVTILSLGYDLTQPLLAGIITIVGKERSGQAMGLNVFMLFIGFGLGSYLFGQMLRFGISHALLLFSIFQITLSLVSVHMFKREVPSRSDYLV